MINFYNILEFNGVYDHLDKDRRKYKTARVKFSETWALHFDK